jgi:L-ribulose-5-phosphate 3-epimerase
MTGRVSRREFLAASAAAGLGLAVARHAAAAPFKTTLHKAMIQGHPSEASLKGLKDAGFEGIESTAWSTKPEDAAKAREIAEKLGMRIHSVMRAWVNFNNPASVEGDIKSCETALKAAQGYGADAILLVPCRIGGTAPNPWEFDIKFDDTTGHITQVVAGDNEKFNAYIETHNKSSDASLEAVKKLIPVAEETKVVIALENVWNNMWVKPDIFTWFVASFKNPWVKAYLDLGNHVKYAPTEQWVKALGPLVAKCHVKDFKLGPEGKNGNFCKLGEGSVNWPAARQALDDIGYNGWLTDEGGGFPLPELNKRFDLILAGKDPGGREK